MIIKALFLFLINLSFCSVWLRAGKDVTLVLNDVINPKTLTTSSNIRMKVEQQVKVNGKIVIDTDFFAQGEVTKINKKKQTKCWEIKIIAKNVKSVDGQMIALNRAEIIILIPFNEGETIVLNQVISAKILNDIQIKC